MKDVSELKAWELYTQVPSGSYISLAEFSFPVGVPRGRRSAQARGYPRMDVTSSGQLVYCEA